MGIARKIAAAAVAGTVALGAAGAAAAKEYVFGMFLPPKHEANVLGMEPYFEKLKKETTEKGLTVVPLRLYFRGAKVKAEIAVVRGKKQYDKRETEKKREADRETAAAIKTARG